MIVTCVICDLTYDDAGQWTLCPHNPLSAAPEAGGYCRRHDLFGPCHLCASVTPPPIPHTIGVVTDGDGHTATLHASSACGGPFAWLTIRDQEGRTAFHHPPAGGPVAATLHLDREAALELASVLTAFAEGR